MQIGNFKLTVLEFKFEPIDKNYRFYGSYYRGMLGRYLFKKFCILRNANCDSCPLNDKCLYMLTFERYKDALFPPYIINRAEKNYLRITLLGGLVELSDIYIDAFKKQLEIKENGFFHPYLTDIQPNKIVFSSSDLESIKAVDDSFIVDVSFLRLKKNSRLVSCDEMTFNDLLKAIEKRIYLANKFYGDKEYKVFLPEFKGDFKKIECKYEKVKRYSHRKKRLMEIPSMDCSFEVKVDVESIYPFIYLATLLNVGTNASMGFGQLKVKPLKKRP